MGRGQGYRWFWLLLLGAAVACAGPSGLGWSRPATPTRLPSPTFTLTATATDVGEPLEYDITYWALLIPGVYHLYGQFFDDLVVATFTNTGPTPMRVQLSAQIEHYSDWAATTVYLEPNGGTETVHLHPVLWPEAIENLTSMKQANLHIRLRLLTPHEATLEDFTDRIDIYARRDFPWTLYEVVDGLDEHTNNMLLAAWVTPNDPAVEEWIRRAADYHPWGDMPGGYDYSVYDRLEALWEALDNEYEVTYVSTHFNIGDEIYDDLYFQRIRFPVEVLYQQSANCIETTLLWAAAAEALYLHPYIVLVPGHAYVAIDADPEGEEAYFIETTLIGGADFDAAIARGGEEWQEDREHLAAGETWYDMVDVWEARDMGILPMPWR